MSNIVIKFCGKRTAKVYLTRKQWNYRINGLIQYLANLCDKIEWEVREDAQK